MGKETIEDYLLVLGKLGLMVKLLGTEQEYFKKLGILTLDEEELAETIKWNCEKLIISLGDQVRSVGERTPKSWDETLKDLTERLKLEVNE